MRGGGKLKLWKRNGSRGVGKSKSREEEKIKKYQRGREMVR